MTFRDQWKQPEWQKKRLEVMGHYEFMCSFCRSEDKQLQIHHRRYIKGRKVWEYDLKDLDCLCVTCHERETRKSEQLAHLLVEVSEGKDLAIGYLTAQLAAYSKEKIPPLNFDSPGTVDGIADALNMPFMFVVDNFIHEGKIDVMAAAAWKKAAKAGEVSK